MGVLRKTQQQTLQNELNLQNTSKQQQEPHQLIKIQKLIENEKEQLIKEKADLLRKMEEWEGKKKYLQNEICRKDLIISEITEELSKLKEQQSKVIGQKAANTRKTKNLNCREEEIQRLEEELLKKRIALEKEIDIAAEQKIADAKENVQKEKENFLKEVKIYLTQEKERLSEEYSKEKAKKEIEEKERTERIKAIAPKIIVLTAFICFLVFCFVQCQNTVKDENKALEAQIEKYETQIAKYKQMDYYVCMENTQIELEDGETERISKGSLVVLKGIINNDSKIVTKTGKEYIINGAVFILNFQRVKPFDFSEID